MSLVLGRSTMNFEYVQACEAYFRWHNDTYMYHSITVIDITPGHFTIYNPATFPPFSSHLL
jgi:hypothetical protein